MKARVCVWWGWGVGVGGIFWFGAAAACSVQRCLLWGPSHACEEPPTHDGSSVPPPPADPRSTEREAVSGRASAVI